MTRDQDYAEDLRDWYAEDDPDGAELLDDMEYFAGRFLALPTVHHLVLLCLWALHTWALRAFYTTPRLVSRITRIWLR